MFILLPGGELSKEGASQLDGELVKGRVFLLQPAMTAIPLGHSGTRVMFYYQMRVSALEVGALRCWFFLAVCTILIRPFTYGIQCNVAASLSSSYFFGP